MTVRGESVSACKPAAPAAVGDAEFAIGEDWVLGVHQAPARGRSVAGHLAIYVPTAKTPGAVVANGSSRGGRDREFAVDAGETLVDGNGIAASASFLFSSGSAAQQALGWFVGAETFAQASQADSYLSPRFAADRCGYGSSSRPAGCCEL